MGKKTKGRKRHVIVDTLGMRAAVGQMQAAGGGSIVNISSIDGIVGMTGLANVALFLASDESAYCTGAEIVVDGGLIAGVLGPA